MSSKIRYSKNFGQNRSQLLRIFSYLNLWSKPQIDNSQILFAQILGEYFYKNISTILSFHTCANYLSILKIDLAQWPLEWNQANVPHTMPFFEKKITSDLTRSVKCPKLCPIYLCKKYQKSLSKLMRNWRKMEMKC